MSLEDIVYQSLFYFTFFLFGILGISFIIHLFRKQPVRKIELKTKPATIETKENLNTELIIAAKKRREIIAEAQRKRALKLEREKRKAEYRKSRYSVVRANNKKSVATKPIFSSTVIENRSLKFYQ